ncbi:MAG: prepilin-type N-terminal cleavage/methylation domain-containing protein [Cyanobacteria bacterium P01_D01_bin.1]
MIPKIWRLILPTTKSKQANSRGFTLIELLVSMIVASIVISGLLYLVNQLVRIDRREASLENVQRDMQRAMDYITDDLRESVYVYPDPTAVTSLLTDADLPTGPGGTVATPVIAFWRPEFLSIDESSDLDSVDCTTTFSDPVEADGCEALKLRQSYYSLVVYFTLGNTPTDNNANWDGQARIIRYTLPQYKRSVIGPTLAETQGYVAPNNDFFAWAPEAGVDTDGDWAVLVDYVDAPNSSALATDCSTFDAAYTLAPSTASTSNSFMACVSAPGTLALGSNQEVALMLRGSARTAAQAATIPSGSSIPNQSVLPSLESRVLVRGAANKNPNGT